VCGVILATHLMTQYLGICAILDKNGQEVTPKNRDTVLYDSTMSGIMVELELGLDNIQQAIRAGDNSSYYCGGCWYKPLERQFGCKTLEDHLKMVDLAFECGFNGESAGQIAREVLEGAVRKILGWFPPGLSPHLADHFSGLFQGPMVLTRKKALMATYLDQQSAYLRAFTGHIPLFNEQPYFSGHVPSPEKILTGKHSLLAMFSTDDSLFLPVTPKKTSVGTVWANGNVRTTLAGEHLRYVVGNRILTTSPSVMQSVTYSSKGENPVLCEVFERLMRVPKQLRKYVYTRLVGLMASSLTYRFHDGVRARSELQNGRLVRKKECEDIVTFQNSLLTFKKYDVRDYKTPPTLYRPDIAFFIWEYCTAETLRVCNQFGSRLCASHIDSAIVIGDVSPPNGWSVKAKGTFEGHAVGNYICGEHTSASGCPVDGDIVAHFASCDKSPDRLRKWNDDGTSRPWKMNDSGFPYFYHSQKLREDKETGIFQEESYDSEEGLSIWNEVKDE